MIVVGIGGYLGNIFETPEAFAPVWWIVAYALFVGLNIWGVELTFRFAVAITMVALAILIVFWVGAIPHFSMEHALNIPPEHPTRTEMDTFYMHRAEGDVRPPHVLRTHTSPVQIRAMQETGALLPALLADC